MGKSVRSKSEKRKRTIKRQKIENWERLNCEKLSKSIVASLESADNVVMHADGARNFLFFLLKQLILQSTNSR